MMCFPNSNVLIFVLLLFFSGCDSTGQTAKEKLIKSNIENMTFIEGGNFMMGDVGGELVSDSGNIQHLPWSMYMDDDHVHKVILSPFWMSKYETTYGDYDTYSNLTNQEIIFKEFIKRTEFRGAEHPAGVNWSQAKEYCQWLAKESGLPFALPTEAQWEYAARNRGQSIGFSTDDGTIKRGINYSADVAELRGVIGRFPPNPLGLYDLSGNIFEWMSDWYDKDYYKNSSVNDPKGPETGTKKVVRFGDHVTTLYGRAGRDPDAKLLKYGIRCVINAKSLSQ